MHDDSARRPISAHERGCVDLRPRLRSHTLTYVNQRLTPINVCSATRWVWLECKGDEAPVEWPRSEGGGPTEGSVLGRLLWKPTPSWRAVREEGSKQRKGWGSWCLTLCIPRRDTGGKELRNSADTNEDWVTLMEVKSGRPWNGNDKLRWRGKLWSCLVKSDFRGTHVHEIGVAGPAAQSSDQRVREASGARGSGGADPKAVAWKVPVNSGRGEDSAETVSYVTAWKGGAIWEDEQRAWEITPAMEEVGEAGDRAE